MPRNLDRRIEVLVPVENARARQELNALLDSVFADTTNTWELQPDDTYRRLTPGKGAKAHTHQTAMQRRVLARARRQATARGGGR
jgi:polyphosphate kinase